MKRPAKGVAVEDLAQVVLPCYAFPKVDGFRCWLADYPKTSRMSRFPNVSFHNSLSGLLPSDCNLDGEVVVGRRRGKGVLQRTSSGLTSKAGNPDYTVWVFDTYQLGMPFELRYKLAAQIVKELGHPQVRMLKGRYIETLEELRDYAEYCLDLEFEGIITRSPDGRYKEGKATLREQYMLKYKPFEDAEARVTGFYEEQENTNEAKREATGKLKRSSSKAGKKPKGRLGGLIGIDVESGVEVRVGGGFTADQREGLWRIRDQLIGKLFKYKKQKMGEKDKPRHPNFDEFIDWRPEWDMAA